MLNFGSPMTTEMIKIGMQTNLAEMMRKLLNLMEIDINDQLEKLMKVLPELTYLIVGAVLIFFVTCSSNASIYGNICIFCI